MNVDDIRFKPWLVKKGKFQYSLLSEAFSNKTKYKIDKNKVVNINKKYKKLFYNSQNNFVKLKDISEFK